MKKEQGANGRMNETSTGTESDAGMTQAVHDLIALRKVHGFGSALGGHSSTLLEAMLELPNYVRPAWASHPMMTLQWKMRQVAESLARVSRLQ